MSAQMITDSTPDPVIRSCLQKVVPGSKTRAAKRHVCDMTSVTGARPSVAAKHARHTGQAPVAVIHGVKRSNIPALQQQARIFCYYCAADAQPVDLSPADPGVDQPGPAVPIAEVTPSETTPADNIAATIDAETISLRHHVAPPGSPRITGNCCGDRVRVDNTREALLRFEAAHWNNWLNVIFKSGIKTVLRRNR